MAVQPCAYLAARSRSEWAAALPYRAVSFPKIALRNTGLYPLASYRSVQPNHILKTSGYLLGPPHAGADSVAYRHARRSPAISDPTAGGIAYASADGAQGPLHSLSWRYRIIETSSYFSSRLYNIVGDALVGSILCRLRVVWYCLPSGTPIRTHNEGNVVLCRWTPRFDGHLRCKSFIK